MKKAAKTGTVRAVIYFCLIFSLCLIPSFSPAGAAEGGEETKWGRFYNEDDIRSLEGVTAEHLSVSYGGGDVTLSFELRNGSQSRILYGPGYGLYILKGTEYVLLKPFVSGVFLVAFPLDAAECRSLSYDISRIYANIKKGNYRLVFPYSAAGNNERYALAVEFTVE